MAKYYVNDDAQPNGDHEVHEKGCSWLTLTQSTTYLGEFNGGHDAVAIAKTIYGKSNGCAYCCPDCHTS